MTTRSAARLRLQSLDDGIVRLGPQTVHIDVTNGCNTDCVTCWDHSPHLAAPPSAAWKRRRADPGAVRALFDDIATLGGLEAVIVSGMGEPFTHREIYEILADLKSRRLHVTVITNLLAADVQRVIDLGVDTLLLGIHGASEASYLAFHPSWQAMHWQRLHDGLARLHAAGRRDKHVQVICRANAHELPGMIRLAATYSAVRVNFKLASLRGGTEVVGITEAQRHSLLDRDIAAARGVADELGVVHNLDGFELQLRSGGRATAPIESIGCFLGYHYSRITVDGTVLYCCNTDVRVGTLADGTRFSSLWHGSEWQSLRRRLRDGGFFASCSQCGKFEQTRKLSAKFRAAYGEERWLAASGRASDGTAAARDRVRLEVLP